VIASTVTHLRLTHPDLDLWIDVRLREFDGRWLAVADLADEPDIGVGESAEQALRGAKSGSRGCARLGVGRQGVQEPVHDPSAA